MRNRPLKIDDLTINDHYYLTSDDECYYFGTYQKGQLDGDNGLIFNIKKKPSAKDKPGYHYKLRDIKFIAKIFNDFFTSEMIQKYTFVPVPPSKAKDHVDYDDRLIQILNIAFKGRNADVRELVEQIESREANHTIQIRQSIQEIQNNSRINENLCDNLKDCIILIDDVITAGTHFKAIKELLLIKFPNIKVIGVFICRRVIQDDEEI